MNDPVQSITSQVEVIYEKTLSEIEREETDLREQIDRLEKKRNILGKKRDHVHQLRSLVENLTQAIIEAEEICEQEEERKADLDVRIEKVSASLQRLQVEAKRAKTDHNQANKSKIEKYRALSKIVERFGDIKGEILFRSFGIKKFFFLKNPNIIKRLIYIYKSLKKIQNVNSIKNFCKLNYNNINIGLSTYDTYIRYTG
ncbi:hypothetical protein CMK16_07595, partial [Candidatus Poribacteria bacterium]|nr:hypothetical protein [Candidatus Poribacteria bacterium]